MLIKKLYRYFILCALIGFSIINIASAQSEVNQFFGLQLNQLQIIGSHNSYKPGIEKPL